ncbi:hypothetical protein GcM3_196042, partial [Golovinomyces cichoracearum]
LNPLTKDSNGLRALVEVHIEDYKEKNLKDFALWESFKDDFSVRTCEMWDKVGLCSLRRDMRDLLISNGVRLLVHYGGTSKMTMSRSLVESAQTDSWPTLTKEIVDWGTRQGFLMYSPSIKRVENEQKRQQKHTQKNVSRKTSPFDFKRVFRKEGYGNFDPPEDVSYNANQKIQYEEEHLDEIRRLRLLDEERRRILKEDQEQVNLYAVQGASYAYPSTGRKTLPYIASNDVRNTWNYFDRSNYENRYSNNQCGRRPQFDSQPEVNGSYNDNENWSSANFSKVAANFERTYTNENKYEGMGDNFGYKIRNFKDVCQKMGLQHSQYMETFSGMLKEIALSHYHLSNLAESSFDNAVHQIRTLCAGENYSQMAQAKWNDISLNLIIQENTSKSVSE